MSPTADEAGAPTSAAADKEQDVDLKQWLAARGVSRRTMKQQLRSVYYGCSPRTVGDRHEAALLCERAETVTRGHPPARIYRVRLHRQLLVVRAKRIAIVLDVVVTVTPLDKVDLRAPDLVDLSLTLAPDGLSARLGDPGPATSGFGPPPVSCEQALPRLRVRAKKAGASAWDRLDLSLVRRACAARGSFRWRGGRFVRTRRRPSAP